MEQRSTESSRAACIDIGTNSVLLLVAELADNGWLHEIRFEERITQLGIGVGEDNQLQRDAVDRTCLAVTDLTKVAQGEGAQKVLMVGTHALRRAVNATEVQDAIHKSTGYNVDIVSGDKEARLSFLAVDRSLPHIPSKVTLDIGGGSSELIAGANGKVESCQSLTVGCVMLANQFAYPRELADMRAWLQKFWTTKIDDYKDRYTTLVGVGGTVTSLGAIHLNLTRYNAQKVHGHIMDATWVQDYSEKYASFTPEDRSHITCVSSKRLSVLGYGIEILCSMMNVFGCDRIVVSDAGLRHAVLWKYFNSVEFGN